MPYALTLALFRPQDLWAHLCFTFEDADVLVAAFHVESGLCGTLGGFLWFICLAPSPAIVMAFVPYGFGAMLNKGFS